MSISHSLDKQVSGARSNRLAGDGLQAVSSTRVRLKPNPAPSRTTFEI